MILHALGQWSWLVLARLVGIVTGLIVVALAIPFRVSAVSLSDGRAIVNLPLRAWIWGNDHDGLTGDKRGWWAANTPFGWSADSFGAMYWWAAIRNPANNMRLLDTFSAPVIGSKISYRGRRVVEDKPGMDGWQFVIVENDGKRWFGFYLVHCWSEKRAFVVRLGFKVKPSHQGANEPRKGLTFKLNPFKSI
jgi:hypothetical protein